MRKMARRTARTITLMGLLGIVLPTAPALARHASAPIGYAAPGTGLVLPNGQNNLDAAPVIVACDPASSTGTIRTTLQLGAPGLPSIDPSRDYNVYTIRLSAKTQLWVNGDAGQPYRVQSLCPLQAYNPHAENETTYRNLESVGFAFTPSRHAIKNAQQFFNTTTPAKVMFYVSGDVNP